MTTEQYITLGKRTAIISFLGGTFIFVLYYFSAAVGLFFLGYFYILAAGLTNVIILSILLVRAHDEKDKRKGILKICGLMFLNIPVVLVYCWVALILVNIMRITFTNDTNKELTNIKLEGCESRLIERLEPNESKTLWIDISDDCSLKMEYLLNEELKEEIVIGYASHGMGGKMDYHIGGNNEQPL